MTFSSDLAAFTAKVQARQQAVFVNTAVAVQDSIKFGSIVTGAPGQPVDTGNLLGSWQMTFPQVDVAEISTNVEYAPAVEENWVEPHQRGPYTRKDGAHVREHGVKGHTFSITLPYPGRGGPHSVALTRAGFDLLVNDVVRTTLG